MTIFWGIKWEILFGVDGLKKSYFLNVEHLKPHNIGKFFTNLP